MLVGEVFARVGLDSRDFERSLDRLEDVTKKRALTLGNIFRGALSVTIGMAIFEVVKRGFQTVVKESISFNAQMEQARIGFTTMLGSAERAEAFLNNMAEFAAKTPFEFPELLDASKRMLAYGFAAGDVLPTMEAVGNATAALGLGAQGIDRIILALGQMRAKGKLSGEEMRQLTEAGIPAWEMLAEAMGKTTAEIMDMQSKGLIPADRAIKMLVEGMNKRFPDMMKKMENTWEGVTSTIRDVWRMTIGALTSNLFKGVVTWLQKVRDFATEFYNTFRQFGLQAALTKSFGPEFAAAINIAVSALRGLWSTAKTVLSAIAMYWAIIKPLVLGALIAFLSFRLVNWVFGLAAKAVEQFTFITAVMRGEAVATSGILNFVARAVQIYRLQLHLASMAGIQHIGILQSLRIALYSVWTAMGPLGWAILVISAALTGGITLWGKYVASVEKAKLQKVLQSVNNQETNLAAVNKQVAQSGEKAANALKDQADASKKASKEAGKNIQSFDEVHLLQEDIADSAKDLADSMGLDDADLGVPEVGVGGFEIPDIGAQLEEMKPTLAGFWDWIKENIWGKWEDWVQSWDWVQKLSDWLVDTFYDETTGKWGLQKAWGKWEDWVQSWDWVQKLSDWLVDTFYDETTGKWGLQKVWGNWEDWVQSWDWVQKLSDWIVDTFFDAEKGVWSLNKAWETFIVWAGGIWDSVKVKWNMFVEWVKGWDIWTWIGEKWNNFKEWVADMWDGAKDKWENFKTSAGEIWEGIKTNVQTKWEELKTNAPVIWENIKTGIQTRWENLKTSAGETWNNITTGIKEKWNNLKTNAPTVWENIKTSIQDRWDSLASGASEKWENIKSTISEKWGELKTNAPTVWENIKTSIQNRWENLKTNAPTTWENIKKEISDRWEALKTDAPTAWENIRKSINDKWDALKTNAPITWEEIKKKITDRWEALKKDVPKTWGEIAGKLANIWEGIKTSASEKWKGVKTVIKGAINGIIGFINKFIRAWNKIELKVPSIDIPLIGTVGGWSVRLPQIPEIPMLAKGGLVMDPTLAMLGEAGPEAVIPLGRSGFASDLADAVGQAVYRAMMDAIRITQASGHSGDNKELVLKIDNTVLARMQLPALTREAQRQGFNLVLRPQGV